MMNNNCQMGRSENQREVATSVLQNGNAGRHRNDSKDDAGAAKYRSKMEESNESLHTSPKCNECKKVRSVSDVQRTDGLDRLATERTKWHWLSFQQAERVEASDCYYSNVCSLVNQNQAHSSRYKVNANLERDKNYCYSVNID
jgi:hypothetical protein